MKKKDTLVNLDADGLHKEINLLKKELFNLRLDAATMQVKDYSQFKKLRRRVARAQTFLKQQAASVNN